MDETKAPIEVVKRECRAEVADWAKRLALMAGNGKAPGIKEALAILDNRATERAARINQAIRDWHLSTTV